MKKTFSHKIVFIGSGKVATFLSQALKETIETIQVYSKTLANARKLGEKLGCSFTNDLKKISTEADLYIIAVKDDALVGVCKKLKLPGKMIVHTSGSTDLNILKKISNKYGVLWPMYSFTGSSNLKPFPASVSFFVESPDKKTEKVLTGIVKDLKGKPYYMNSGQRGKIHMTAVFVNNFPNHLFTIAETLCKEAGVPFSIFFPLAEETFENIKNQSPSMSQTGPANRNDKRILKKHLALLKPHPIYKDIYKVLTKSIIETNRGRKKL